ncbi:MAG: serine/threonine protein phosphatase, partial [Leptospira sp.]|nr:serine/threonine protein phosphatase [Leptospira sp.]
MSRSILPVRSLFLIFLFHSLWLFPVVGEDRKELDGKKITDQFSYKIDSKKNLEFLEIQNRSDFLPIQDEFVNFGFVTGNLWLKLPNSKSLPHLENYLLFLNAQNIDSIQIFYQTNSGEWKEDSSGHIVPMSKRFFPHRNFIFQLKDIGTESPIYLKVNSDISIQFSIRLIQEESLQKEDYTKQWIYGLFFGSLFLIFLYNIAVSFFVR